MANPDLDVIGLTNPVEHVSEDFLQTVLSSESVLLIRVGDVTSAWARGSDLSPVLARAVEDPRWVELNVIGKKNGSLPQIRSRRFGFSRSNFGSDSRFRWRLAGRGPLGDSHNHSSRVSAGGDGFRAERLGNLARNSKRAGAADFGREKARNDGCS